MSPPQNPHSAQLPAGMRLVGLALLAQIVKNLPTMQEIWVQSRGHEDPLEKGRLHTPVFLLGEFHGQRSLVGYIQSMGLQKVRHDWMPNTFIKR